MPSRRLLRSPRIIVSTYSGCCAGRRERQRAECAPNTLTFHFDRLRTAGLLTVRRDGRSMIYAARFETMNAPLGYLTENCCQGAPEACASLPICKPQRTRHAKVTA
jgi:hypothetical protein